MMELEHNGHRILVGRDREDNVRMLKAYGNTDYVFLHLKSYPSSHVCIMNNRPCDETLQVAARACKANGKYRNLKNVKAIYTAYSNVRETDVPGAVVFRSNRKVTDMFIKA